MKSRKLKAALAYWWLLVESGNPSAVFTLDLAEPGLLTGPHRRQQARHGAEARLLRAWS